MRKLSSADTAMVTATAQRTTGLLTAKRAAALPLVAALALALAVAPGAAGSAAVAHCPSPAPGYGPKNDPSLPIGDVTTHAMSCSAARTAIRKGSFSVHGSCFGIPGSGPCRSTFTTPGFHCNAAKLGTVRCSARARRFSFGWSE